MFKRSLFFLLLGALVLCASAHAVADVNISLNSVMDLNGKSRADILDLRQRAVDQVPDLSPRKYRPSKQVFGRMKSGKPWWGLLGICHYGPGRKSILGNSKESRFIRNPYLLVGVEEAHGLMAYGRSATSEEFYPEPTQLTWDEGRAWGSVTYNVSGFYAALVRY
ncbi:MAG: hypothetical protein HQL21_07255, partial [Candidatus Omnitrophica bacterium]|nr:hypothetical protein [Candidatus Omnitrophota bacterium]